MSLWKNMTLGLLAVLTALPVLAEETKEKKKKGNNLDNHQVYKLPDTISLDDAQKEKLTGLKKEYAEKLKAAIAKQNEFLTAEQLKARADAAKAAKAAGKKGKDAQADIDAAVNLTPEQKEKKAAADKEMKELSKEIREKLEAFLTDSQKALLKTKKKKEPAKTA